MNKSFYIVIILVLRVLPAGANDFDLNEPSVQRALKVLPPAKANVCSVGISLDKNSSLFSHNQSRITLELFDTPLDLTGRSAARFGSGFIFLSMLPFILGAALMGAGIPLLAIGLYYYTQPHLLHDTSAEFEKFLAMTIAGGVCTGVGGILFFAPLIIIGVLFLMAIAPQPEKAVWGNRALKNNDTNRMQQLLDMEYDVNAQNSEGNTLLMLACLQGNKEMAELLISSGADVTLTNNRGQSALDLAYNHNHFEIVELLLKHYSTDDNRALRFAVKHNLIDLVKNLVARGFDPLKNDAVINTGLKIYHTMPYIDLAAYAGDLEMVRYLISLGLHPDEQTLYFALLNSKLETAEYLLTFDISLDNCLSLYESKRSADSSPGSYLETMGINNTLVVRLTMAGKAETLSFIVEFGGDITPYGEDAFLAAVIAGEPDILELLISLGVDVNYTNKFGDTALSLAVKTGYSQETARTVELLLSHGADGNIRDKEGRTLLMIALNFKNEKVARLLIKGGVNIHAADNEGVTCLMYAVKNFEPALVQTLIDLGADVNSTDNLGQTVLDYLDKLPRTFPEFWDIRNIVLKTGAFNKGTLLKKAAQ